ncbi:hypothetical protein ABID60_001297 [Bradyrhizobium sp. S3.5.5]
MRNQFGMAATPSTARIYELMETDNEQSGARRGRRFESKHAYAIPDAR